MNDTTETRARVIVNFRTSSTKGGQPAYEVTVTSDATEADVDNAVAMAVRARQACEEELDGDMRRDLEKSVPSNIVNG